MFDTYITIVGTALQAPERRKLEKSGAVVASFRVISNARRFDKENQVWVDGANLRIKVNCWRRLVDGVVGSVYTGDPVIVHGRISTREWQNEQGETRFAYEVDAETVGHDLSRGTAEFHKLKPDAIRPVIEDEDSENRVNGELAHAYPDAGGPTLEQTVGDRVPGESGSGLGYGDSYDMSDIPDTDHEAMAILRNAGLDPSTPDDEGNSGGEDDSDEGEIAGADSGSGGPGSRSRRRGRQPVPA